MVSPIDDEDEDDDVFAFFFGFHDWSASVRFFELAPEEEEEEEDDDEEAVEEEVVDDVLGLEGLEAPSRRGIRN